MPIRNQLERDLRVDLQDEPTRADHPLPVTQPACNITWVGTGVECQAASVVVTRTRSLIAWSDNAAPDGEAVDRRTAPLQDLFHLALATLPGAEVERPAAFEWRDILFGNYRSVIEKFVKAVESTSGPPFSSVAHCRAELLALSSSIDLMRASDFASL